MMAAFAVSRFIKFGIVGASGAAVNVFVLWLCQEYLLRGIVWEGLRINLSLVLAIVLSTTNNYCWNRWWTWRDRKEQTNRGFWLQMAAYFSVCWAAIALQILLTNLLRQGMHYLPANLAAIAMAAVVNFMANDAWTFSVHRIRRKFFHIVFTSF
jgi:putative flippase GtrA